jgi:peptide chain release factor 2
LWSDQATAQGIMRERTQLEQSIEEVTAIEQELEDSMTLIELGEAERYAGAITHARCQARARDAAVWRG